MLAGPRPSQLSAGWSCGPGVASPRTPARIMSPVLEWKGRPNLEAPPEQRRLTILAWEAYRTCSGGARRTLFFRMAAGSWRQLQTRSSEQEACGVSALSSISRRALTQTSRSLPSFEHAAPPPITSVRPGKSGAKSSSQFHDANAGTLVPRMAPRRPSAATGRRREVMKRADMLTIRCERT